jgi:segregation and condensation protein B
MKPRDIIAIIEGILFLSGDSVSMDDIARTLDMTKNDISQYVIELEEQYNTSSRGLMISKIGDNLRLTTKPEIFPYIEKMFKPKVKTQLSKAALETLAIIMFKQPVTKAEIEMLRGVNVEKALNGLLEKNLVEETGRLDTPGRPILYETTQLCMEHFGLNSFEDIPEELKKRII